MSRLFSVVVSLWTQARVLVVTEDTLKAKKNPKKKLKTFFRLPFTRNLVVACKCALSDDIFENDFRFNASYV